MNGRGRRHQSQASAWRSGRLHQEDRPASWVTRTAPLSIAVTVKQQIDLAARLLRALGAVGFVSRLAVPRRAAARTSPQPWYARGDRSAPLNGKTSDVMPMLGADTIRESMR
jgi:hypothetical protein